MAKEKAVTDNKVIIKRLLKYIKKYLWIFILSCLFAFISSAASIYIPVLVGQCVDMIIGKGLVDFDGLILKLLLMGIIVLGIALCQWLMNICNNGLTYRVVRDVRSDAIRKIQHLPISYVDSHSHGDIVSRIISDVDTFADGLLMGFGQFFTGIVTIVGTLVFMFVVNVKLSILVVVLTPLSLFVAAFIAKRTHGLFVDQSKLKAEQTGFIGEIIDNQKVVKALCHEDEAIEEFDNINKRLETCSLKATFYSSTTNPSTRFINNMVYAAVALYGGFLAFAGTLSIGSLVCMLSYANQYTKPFNEISSVITELQNAIATAGRIFEFLDEAEEIPDTDNQELTDVFGNVTIKNVDFSYVEDKKLIENFNLDVPAGKRVAIVGPTGCGKTTIINLLMRFYDVDSGTITVEGKSIADLKRSSLRENYGMVLQETWLYHGTIKDNIRLGNPEATDEEVIQAAKACHAHSFIEKLPNGYDTVVSENMGGLSEGQRQLICISRVMLRIPPMLILDEATSSIDTRTELKIQEAFARLMKNRTSFIVAHRLSTIKNADVILVMKDGSIIEKGSHEELLAKQGFYSTLYKSQFQLT